MQHQDCTEYLRKELDFLKILIHRFHDQEKIPHLELDIAILKAQDIYEHLLRLKLMPEADGSEKPVAAKKPAIPDIEEKKAPEPVVVQKVEKIKNPEKQPEVSEMVAAPIEKPEKKETPKVEEPVQEKELPKKEKPASTVLKAETAILAETLKTSQHPINETWARKNQTPDLSSRLQTAPLQSIAAGIGLNEKFLYIRELFQGNGESYNEAIKELDAAASLVEALDFVERQFNWDMESETVQKFVHLIHRRHAGNGV